MPFQYVPKFLINTGVPGHYIADNSVVRKNAATDTIRLQGSYLLTHTTHLRWHPRLKRAKNGKIRVF